jgi:predicted nucleic acid-binding protein
MKLIDANVVIYSIGRPHDYRDASRRVITLSARRELDATVDTEVLQEVLNYYHRLRRTEQALQVFDDLVISLPEPYGVAFSTITLARQVLADHPLLQSRDAVHAAVVFEHRLEGIISADRAFDGIAGLTRFDPKELAV